MKRIVSMILVLALLLACAPAIPLKTQAATVASGTVGNLKWTINSDGLLHISGKGAIPNYTSTATAPWHNYRKNVTKLTVGDGVTSIGDFAFFDLPFMTTATIGNYIGSSGICVESIGNASFAHCDSLKSIDIPDTVITVGEEAFSCCYSLKSMVVGKNVSSFGKRTFESCYGMTEIYFRGDAPSGYIFYSGIKTTYYPASNTTWTTIVQQYYDTTNWVPYCPDGHTVVTIKGKEATCTTDGLSEGKYCSACGEIFSVQTTIPAGHTLKNGICTKCKAYGECGSNLIWTFTADGTLTISGAGAMYDYSNIAYVDGIVGGPWYEIRKSVQRVIVENDVTSIGHYAFTYCTNIVEVTIGNSVKSIGYKAFASIKNMTSVNIPASVTQIYQHAFSSCNNLEEITFEGSAPKIYEYAFDTVTATAYYYPDATWTEDVRQNYGGTITWTPYAAEPEYSVGLDYDISDDETYYIVTGIGDCQDTKVIIPATHEGLPVKEIGNDAFGFDSGAMTSVVIPDSVTRIGDGAFGACYDLTEVVIGNGVTSIGAYAFVECTGLTSIEIPDSVISIGDNAFGSCSGLTEVTIGKSVSQIGSSVFSGCVALEQIVVDEENTSYCSDAYGALYNKDKTSLVCCPAAMTGTYTVPGTVASIEAWAFGYCDELTAVVIPASITSIGVDAFAYCTSLSEITFLGSAPTFVDTDWNAGTFYKVNATAYYYPDATWTEDVRQDYGGTITWVPYNQEHTCTHTPTVTAPTCTEQGYTTYTCAECGDSYIDDYTDALGHDHQHTSTTEPSCTEDGCEIFTCSRCGDVEEKPLLADGHHYGDDDVCDDCGHTASGGVPENALQLPGDEFAGQDTVWIEGVPYPVQGEGEDRYIALPEAEEFLMVTYTYHEGDGQDVHTQYPTGMKVYQVKDGEITYIPELENLLQYSGSSIRITGKKGIRMITSIEKDKKTALTSKGLAGYTLVEYGTVLCFASEIPEDDGLVLGRDYARSNYAYKKGVADPVFATSGNLVQYTNVLVGFSLDQCKDDIAMRPYIILQNDQGEQITLYGGTIYRSIGYIAYQNRNVFQPKTASYNYVWEIIHHVYGDKYDEEFKG